MTSKASAKALTIKELTPFISLESLASYWEISTSGTPPPGTSPLFFTRDLTTHKASWRLLSASSITWLIWNRLCSEWEQIELICVLRRFLKYFLLTSELEPLQRIVTVLAFDWTPVILRILESSANLTSSQTSAWPSFSGVRLSMCATGMAPIV